MAEPLVAVFADPDTAARALSTLREAEVAGVRVVASAPFPAVHGTGRPGPWRLLGKVSLLGGLAGLACAIVLQAVTSESMGLVVGGKPILAWPAFGVIMFELTLLFAGLANFLVLVVLAATSRRGVPKWARAKVDSDSIVVMVPGDQLAGARGAAVRRALAAAGEVRP